VSSTDLSAPTTIFHPDTAHSNESNTRHKHNVPSHNRWHQPAPLSATELGKSTAQTDLDNAEYADAPNPNPAGESVVLCELL
jgi:hypothetical protein